MKATELRIGNYIEFCDNESWSLHIVVPKDLHVMHMLDSDLSESYRPIPLTKQWLRKFGFDYEGKTFHWYTKGKVSISFTEGRMVLDIGVSYNQFKIPEYVHQLQNLYFALTGEELTLSS